MLLVWLSSAVFAAETMRIAVGPESSKVMLEGDALRVGADADDAVFEAFATRRVSFALVEGKLMVEGSPSPARALRFRSGEDGSGVIAVNGVRVKGDVVVLFGKTQLAAVNVLGLEDYLVGVIGSEMPKSFPTEALKAQAIAARTYALNKKLEQYSQPYHLGSSVISQVYKGLDVEDPRTRDAVESTRGLVMTWQLQPIEAYFHSSCGGRTESGGDALGRDLPYLKAVDCPCGHLPTSHWTLNLKQADLKALGGTKAGALKVQGRSSTGRARRVEVGARSLDAVTFRERIGYMKLKSLHFEIEKSGDGWKVEGSGFGHGAGLCQWGARVYAEKGWDYRKILQHYYPGVELQTLYE
ncbi:MAG: SpoIID/LytB domain-containing protein [Archangium sp.]|nr:SpoIID/LytB domain-containing protein [Archangium sp.]MDP3573186.1 SpoIID/LytB domain-containing protein [Archangium sp.]